MQRPPAAPKPFIIPKPTEELIGHIGGFSIYAVPDEAVKLLYDVDFTEGGNGRAYFFVAPDHIIISKRIPPGHRIFVFFHEAPEFLGMSPQMDYWDAHAWGDALEYAFRVYVTVLLRIIRQAAGYARSEEDLDEVIEQAMVEAERVAFNARPSVVDPEVTPAPLGMSKPQLQRVVNAMDHRTPHGEVLLILAAMHGVRVHKSHAVDFDGTLAEAPSEWKGSGYVGKPIPAMVAQIKQWLADGEEVKILTARVSSKNPPDEVAVAERAIRMFLLDQFGAAGARIEITAEKDPGMQDITDDKAIAVEPVVEQATAEKVMRMLWARVVAKGEKAPVGAITHRKSGWWKKVSEDPSVGKKGWVKIAHTSHPGPHLDPKHPEYNPNATIVYEKPPSEGKKKPEAAPPKWEDVDQSDKVDIAGAMVDHIANTNADLTQQEASAQWNAMSDDEKAAAALEAGIMDSSGGFVEPTDTDEGGAEPGWEGEPATEPSQEEKEGYISSLSADDLHQLESVVDDWLDQTPDNPFKAKQWTELTNAQLYDAAVQAGHLGGQEAKGAKKKPAGKPAATVLNALKPAAKLEDVEVKAKLGGTTGAERIYYKIPGTESYADGVLKHGAAEGQAAEENLANKIYTVLGAACKSSDLYEQEGKPVLVGEWISAGTTKLYSDLSPEDQEKAKQIIRKHFVLDAILANWDVTGTGGDNIMYNVKTGQAWRIDNGGALRFRAQGTAKGSAFGKTVGELETMRDPQHISGAIFGGMTDDEVRQQIKTVLTKDNVDNLLQLVGQADPELRKTVAARVAYCKQWAEGKPAAEAKPAKGHKFDDAGYPILTTQEKSALSSYKGSGYHTINTYLREYQGAKDNPSVAKQVEHLDAIFADAPEQALDVYRGVGASMLTAMLKGLGAPALEASQSKKPPFGANWTEYLTHILGGVTFGDCGYVSTSKSQHFSESWGGTSAKGFAALMRITGKSRAVEIKHYHGGDSEHEVLLPRGSRFKIKDVNVEFPGGGVRVVMDVEVTQLPQPKAAEAPAA